MKRGSNQNFLCTIQSKSGDVAAGIAAAEDPDCGEFVSFSQLTGSHIEGIRIPLKGSTVLRRPI
jgi:hypothetical protein